MAEYTLIILLFKTYMCSKCYQNQPDVARMKPSIDSNQHLLLKTKEPNEVFCCL